MQRSAARYGHRGPLKHIVVDGAKGALLHTIDGRISVAFELSQYNLEPR